MPRDGVGRTAVSLPCTERPMATEQGVRYKVCARRAHVELTSQGRVAPHLGRYIPCGAGFPSLQAAAAGINLPRHKVAVEACEDLRLTLLRHWTIEESLRCVHTSARC